MAIWSDLWRGFARNLPRGRYTRALELEVARLRAENRALVDSILGLAGIPPLRLDAEVGREHRAPDRPGIANLSSNDLAAPPVPARAGVLLPANPLRRRSWQQIGRMLEIEEARRAANRDTTTTVQLPAARRS